jgi:hypothetical protein
MSRQSLTRAIHGVLASLLVLVSVAIARGVDIQ